MVAFVYLYLGHLMGDFVFQNSWIALNKGKRRKALFLHAFIIVVTQLLCLSPENINLNVKILLVALGIGTAHYFVDLFKIKLKTNWKTYLLDQLFHTAILISVVPLFKETVFWIPYNIAVNLLVGIFNAYFLSIFFHLIYDKNMYRRDWIGYLYRFLMPWFTGFYFLVYASAGFFVVGWYYNGLRVNQKCRYRVIIMSNIFSIISTIIWEVIL